MKDNGNEQESMNSACEDLSGEADRQKIGDMSPPRRNSSWLTKGRYAKQHSLAALHYVSRATSQDIAQSEDDIPFLQPPGQASEAFDIEISELPPTRRSHYLLLKLAHVRARWTRRRSAHTPSLHVRRKRSVARVLTVFGVLATLLVLFLGNTPGLRGWLVGFLAPTPTPTQETRVTVGNMPIIVNHFGTVPPSDQQESPGSLPATCPQISTLQYFTSPLDPPGLGASLLWLSGFTGPSAALDHLLPINAQVAHSPWPGGWYETIAVFVRKGYTGNIILQGSSQRGNAPVWLSKNDPRILGNTLTLDLNDGSHYLSDGQWEMASITLAVPAAGCYRLQASWPEGSWTRFFAAGR